MRQLGVHTNLDESLPWGTAQLRRALEDFRNSQDHEAATVDANQMLEPAGRRAGLEDANVLIGPVARPDGAFTAAS